MDVESKETISSSIDRLQKSGDEVVDRAAAAASIQLTSAVVQMSAAVRPMLDEAIADLRSVLAGLDGWTLDIAIPTITIRLSKPKESA